MSFSKSIFLKFGLLLTFPLLVTSCRSEEENVVRNYLKTNGRGNNHSVTVFNYDDGEEVEKLYFGYKNDYFVFKVEIEDDGISLTMNANYKWKSSVITGKANAGKGDVDFRILLDFTIVDSVYVKKEKGVTQEDVEIYSSYLVEPIIEYLYEKALPCIFPTKKDL